MESLHQELPAEDSSEVPVVPETPAVQSEVQRVAAALEDVRHIQDSFPKTPTSTARGWS